MYRLEYLTPAGWIVGHAKVALADPGAYTRKLADRGIVARFTPVDTCPVCGDAHAEPFDGSCLI